MPHLALDQGRGSPCSAPLLPLPRLGPLRRGWALSRRGGSGRGSSWRRGRLGHSQPLVGHGLLHTNVCKVSQLRLWRTPGTSQKTAPARKQHQPGSSSRQGERNPGDGIGARTYFFPTSCCSLVLWLPVDKGLGLRASGLKLLDSIFNLLKAFNGFWCHACHLCPCVPLCAPAWARVPPRASAMPLDTLSIVEQD